MSKYLLTDWDENIIRTGGAGPADAYGMDLVPGVIPALLRFTSAGFEILPTTNRGELSGPERSAAAKMDAAVLRLLRSQGVAIADLRVCTHNIDANCSCRKPGPGLLTDVLPSLDRSKSCVVDVDESGRQFALNIGVAFTQLDAAAPDGWQLAAHQLLDNPRQADFQRTTRETDIRVKLDLDASADPQASTGLPFFDHMLEQLGKHGGFSLAIVCNGDLEIDEHHTIEDVALALGGALREALGEKRGIDRYGFVLPMDETRAEVSIDLGGRPYLVFSADFPREEVGGMPTELVEHFFRSFSDALGASVHISVQGENTHHMIEACFKGLARALRMAVRRSGDALPSTKGVL